jgi:hypothetical protein
LFRSYSAAGRLLDAALNNSKSNSSWPSVYRHTHTWRVNKSGIYV